MIRDRNLTVPEAATDRLVGVAPASAPATAAVPSATARAGVSPAAAHERKFRPDIEGLRAVAVALVVLYHAHVPGIDGGFVGVDVFFVISGFLITGLLLREHAERGSVSLLGFYARRARRILPASTVVLLFTLFASYHWLGFLTGDSVATDASWTAVFSANIHFAFVGTSYFGSQAAPSPLLHMWSLGVEEQFYVVWPTAFLLVALLARRLGRASRRIDTRVALGVFLAATIVASFTWSVVETSSSSTWAYYSPLTRAWELAAGGLIAVAAPLLGRVPRRMALAMSGIGLGGIVASALVLNPETLYPGAAVAYPVVASVLVIAGGTVVAALPAERLLRLRPFQWLGARSYSLYLWHWPILIIAAQYAGKSLPLWQNLLWVLAAIAAAALSYRLVENPIRRARFLATRPLLSVGMGLALISISLGVAQWQLHTH